MLTVMLLSRIRFHEKPSHLVLHVMPNAWGTLLERDLRICSEEPHSQFHEGTRSHLFMDKWNRPTPVLRRLSLTQIVWGKLVPTGLALVLGIKTRSLKAFSQYSAFHLRFVYSKARMPSPARLFKRFCAAGTNGRLDLNLSWRASEGLLNRP